MDSTTLCGPRSDEQLNVMLSILDGRYVPTGVAIDDSGAGLLSSIEDYSGDHQTPVKIDLLQAGDRDTIRRQVGGRDFFLVDHRLQDRFHGCEDGLEVVEIIREENPRVPLFYYTAWPDDLRTGDG